MNKTKLLEKGYRIECVSWENDGDNYRTEYITVDTLEEAQLIHKIMTELFQPSYRSESGISVGNSMDWDKSQETIKEYIETNKIDLDILYAEDISELAYDLMGSSEYYDYRVCESVSVHHIQEDVYVEQII